MSVHGDGHDGEGGHEHGKTRQHFHQPASMDDDYFLEIIFEDLCLVFSGRRDALDNTCRPGESER